MQAVVKTPHIEIKIKGDIPLKLLELLKDEYGKNVKVIKEKDDEYVDIFKSDWYKKIKKNIKPGDNLKVYREIHGMTQTELGQKLGRIPRQHVSNMERGIRSISLKNAKKLAKLFKVSVDKFV